MKRPFVAVAVTCAALVVPAIAAADAGALGVPTVKTPTVTTPTVSLPAATAPSATTPTVTVPPVSVGPITTPPVTTPSLTTPSISTPSTTSSPIQTPPVKTPSLGLHSGTSPSAPPSAASAASTGSTSQSEAPSVSAGSTPGAPSSAGRVRSTVGGVGASHQPGARAARAGSSGSSRRPGVVTAATTAAATSNSQPGSPGGSGSDPSTTSHTQTKGSFARLVKVLPTAVLFALLAFAVIAAGMALNAYLQSRRAKSLAGQRAALLSDVGVLQAALLPAVPESLGELDVTVAYRPAQGLAAGGDFFDVFTVGPERTGIIIGDVSGHGRESLIHAALVRYTLRALMGEGHSLPEVLARADRYLTGELGDGFATVVICCYEHPTGELTWAKAGHEPPMIAGQPDRDERAATPLGFGMGENWPQFSRALDPGDRVCLFTDGLVEARHQGQHLGRTHLKALVDQGLDAHAIVEQIQADSDDCPDDLAAVVISRAAVAAPLEPPVAPQTAAVS
jgi:hypothetical protein